MDLAFRDRALTADELEALRLILSTFRDGSGQNVLKPFGRVMPGFRDFERTLADVLQASAPENKGVFDVIVNDHPLPFGISCKMSKTQPPANQSSFMELSNSAAKFRDHLLKMQIHWMSEPTLAGPVLIDLVESWHLTLQHEINIGVSKYAVLAHNAQWTRFQLLCFPLNLKLAKPKGDIEWLAEGAALNGYIDAGGRRHRLWQVYMNSGGQMKYYPLLSWADWVTDEFELEEPPLGSLRQRAKEYFPTLWPSSISVKGKANP
jgi:hypothetical protein